MRVKDLSPALCDKECNVKVIVMESNAKDEANASNNATLLVGDDTGCVSLVLPKTVAVHVRPGDILQLAPTQVVMKSSRLYLWGGKVERVGEFLMLFKEGLNVSNITWVKDPANPDVLVGFACTFGPDCNCWTPADWWHLLYLNARAFTSCCCRSRAVIPPNVQSQ